MQRRSKVFLGVTLAIVLAAGAVSAQGNQKLRVAIDGFKPYNCTADSCLTYYADRGSKFIIVEAGEESMTVIFKKVRGARVTSGTAAIYADTAFDSDEPVEYVAPDVNTRRVIKNGIYKIDTQAMPWYTYRLQWGIDHGPLVVPFKFRTNDKSLSGQSSLGYYIGIRADYLLVSGTLFLSAGLTPIPISDLNSESSENRMGMTAAVGFSMETTRQFQLAFVAGMDHLGGESGKIWDYEDNLWLSFAIGFNFTGGE